MKNLIFNSSMPRSCSTLLQNIFNQRPDTYATPTDGVIELLAGAKERFTNSDEFRASKDQDLMLKAWRNFAKKGIHGYAEALTDKENVVLKGRAYKGNIIWMQNFLQEDPKIICMVRNLKSIAASFEKMYRKNPDKTSQWYIAHETRGTTVDKRVDMYMKNIPVSISLDQILDGLQQGLDSKMLYIRAEDLTSNPKTIMNELYERIGLSPFEHNFDYIEQTTHENDVIHGLDNELHKIKNKIEPLKEDYVEILGIDACNFIDTEYAWYQKYFGYIN